MNFRFNKTVKFVFCFLFVFSSDALGKEPQLKISTNHGEKIYRLSGLEKRRDLEVVVVENGPAYPGKTMKVIATVTGPLKKYVGKDLHGELN